MVSSIKELAITAGISIVVAVGGYTIILNHIKANDQTKIDVLQQQVNKLADESKQQAIVNKTLQDNVDKSTKAANDAASVTNNALALLAKLQQPVTIPQVKDIEDVKSSIAKNYGDPTVTFNDTNFSIAKFTTFHLVDDAVQWKVNGPILQSDLAGTKTALDASLNQNKADSAVMQNQTLLITGINKSLDLCNQENNDKDKQIDLFKRDLKIESMSGNIKLVFGVTVGAGSYYIYDHFIKR